MNNENVPLTLMGIVTFSISRLTYGITFWNYPMIIFWVPKHSFLMYKKILKEIMLVKVKSFASAYIHLLFLLVWWKKERIALVLFMTVRKNMSPLILRLSRLNIPSSTNAFFLILISKLFITLSLQSSPEFQKVELRIEEISPKKLKWLQIETTRTLPVFPDRPVINKIRNAVSFIYNTTLLGCKQ